MSWDSYMENYAYGNRHYVMKGDPSTVDASIRKAKFLLRAHQALIFSLTVGALMFLGMFDPFDLSVCSTFSQFVLDLLRERKETKNVESNKFAVQWGSEKLY